MKNKTRLLAIAEVIEENEGTDLEEVYIDYKLLQQKYIKLQESIDKLNQQLDEQQ